jgi:hypothetical protein
MIRGPEVRLRHCLGNLLHDLLEDRVFRSERNRSLDLYFEDCRFAGSVMRSNDYVIEVHALRGTLHLDPVDDRSGKASGWRLNQHREQVVGSHFGFEVGASGTG